MLVAGERMNRVAKYFRAHWRGELSLAISLLVNGLLFYIVLVAALVLVGQASNSQAFVYVALAVFAAWTIWALVGIFRSAIKQPGSSFFRRIISVAAITLVFIVSVVIMRDLVMLFG
jgi:hypothetical protein